MSCAPFSNSIYGIYADAWQQLMTICHETMSCTWIASALVHSEKSLGLHMSLACPLFLYLFPHIGVKQIIRLPLGEPSCLHGCDKYT